MPADSVPDAELLPHGAGPSEEPAERVNQYLRARLVGGTCHTRGHKKHQGHKDWQRLCAIEHAAGWDNAQLPRLSRHACLATCARLSCLAEKCFLNQSHLIRVPPCLPAFALRLQLCAGLLKPDSLGQPMPPDQKVPVKR